MPVKIFYTQLGKLVLSGAALYTGRIIMLKQERNEHKLLTWSWKNSVVENIILCCSCKIYLHWNKDAKPEKQTKSKLFPRPFLKLYDNIWTGFKDRKFLKLTQH